MNREKLIQAINWETIVSVCNKDTDKACKIWDKYNHVLLFPISSDFSLWAINLNVSISKLFEIYTYICEDFKSLPKKTIITTYGDENWPNQINDFPFSTRVLYCLGNVELLKKKNVAILGTKAPSKEAIEKLGKIVKDLVKKEIIITSGLSLGMQGHAGVKSLSDFAPVIAVIATPLDQYYPQSHSKIQDYIAQEGGVVVTRVAPNNKNIKWNILLRNRLMSALSSAIMIIEEVDSGGAIQIAEYSLQNNRNVYFFSSLKKDTSLNWPKQLLSKGAKSLRYPSDLAKAINGVNTTKISKKDNNKDIVQLKLF